MFRLRLKNLPNFSETIYLTTRQTIVFQSIL